MVNLDYYLNDGAKFQEQAILMLIRGMGYEVTCQKLPNTNLHPEIHVGRYENCREQGYVVSLVCGIDQLAHYCFFEHRNSDDVCIIKFKGTFMDTPRVDAIWEGRENKYDVDMSFGYNEVVPTAEWIISDMLDLVRQYVEEKENK